MEDCINRLNLDKSRSIKKHINNETELLLPLAKTAIPRSRHNCGKFLKLENMNASLQVIGTLKLNSINIYVVCVCMYIKRYVW